MRLKSMTPEIMKRKLEDILRDLSDIAPEDLTTFELNLIRSIADFDPPPEYYLPFVGAESKILGY